ncbi:MAG: anthranilate synthase component I, partial [Planctomycetaceae bacterium]
MRSPTTLPTSAEFEKLARQARFVPVYRQLTSDTLTPVTAWQRIAGGAWAFLFESVVGGERVGRYSFVGSNPFMTLTASGRTVVIQSREGERQELHDVDPLQELERLVAACRSVHLPGLPGFLGGAVGYAAY